MAPSLSILGNSSAIRSIVEEARYAAATDAKVLITGESGTGKELLARLIHTHSARSQAPLVTINCSGIAETLLESELFGHMRGSFTDAHRDRRGLLELAHGGTVLLDEVGEMSLRMQTVLLRFLESGEIQRVGSERHHTVVDVRIVSATNRDLLERTNQKEFRLDLYYRLNVIYLTLPPLRERRDDIPMLTDHFLNVFSKQHSLPMPVLTPDVLTHVVEYSWPGNIRELRNVAERFVLRNSVRPVSLVDLPKEMLRRGGPDADAVGAVTAQTTAALRYEQIVLGGQSFWKVVYEPFMKHDLTRDAVRAMIRRGLEQTGGSYRLLVELFGMPRSDYKRFLSFLQKHECHMPFQHFRTVGARLDVTRPPLIESPHRRAVC